MTILAPPYILEGLPADVAGLAEPWDSGDPDPADPAGVDLWVPPYTATAADLTLMGRLPGLRVVQTLTAGVDNVLAALPEGVTLCNAAGVHDASTAELAVGLTIASLRHLDEFARAMPEGRWLYGRHEALADKRVLIVGFGAIGRAIARRLAGFEIELIAVARTARDEDGMPVHALRDLPALLPSADVVILILPLTTRPAAWSTPTSWPGCDPAPCWSTSHAAPSWTPRPCSRRARPGRVRAALDVTDPEPLPADHPLWRTPGVLISPHVGGNTSAFLPRARRLVAEQVRRHLAGEPLANVVVVARERALTGQTWRSSPGTRPAQSLAPARDPPTQSSRPTAGRLRCDLLRQRPEQARQLRAGALPEVGVDLHGLVHEGPRDRLPGQFHTSLLVGVGRGGPAGQPGLLREGPRRRRVEGLVLRHPHVPELVQDRAAGKRRPLAAAGVGTRVLRHEAHGDRAAEGQAVHTGSAAEVDMWVVERDLGQRGCDQPGAAEPLRSPRDQPLHPRGVSKTGTEAP